MPHRSSLITMAIIFSTLPCTICYANDDSDSWYDGIQRRLDQAMQSSAQWLDSLASDQVTDAHAKASGHISLGWLPRSGNLGDTAVRFKLKMHLPYWQDKVDLMFEDRDDSLERLPYETSRPDLGNTDANDLVAAVRVKHTESEHGQFSSRLGIGRGQLYARSEYRWRYPLGQWQLQLTPAVEYYWSDGWGTRLLAEASTPLSDHSSYHSAASLRDLQAWQYPEWKWGHYYSHSIDDQRIWVLGALVKDNLNSPEPDRVYTLSWRYRQQWSRSWLYFEVEPFVDYLQKLHYQNEKGIALRIISQFGD